MTAIDFILPAVLLIIISLPLVSVYRKKTDLKSSKFRIKMQIASFFAVTLGSVIFSSVIHADDAVASAFIGSNAQGMGFLSAALAVGCSALGAGIAVAYAAPAAIGAISENSENFGKAMIFVALAEGVALYGLLIAFLIIQKL